MAEKFKAGDVVYLKSGSPKMTIKSISSHGVIICAWMPYETSGMPPLEHGFTAAMLRKADGDKTRQSKRRRAISDN